MNKKIHDEAGNKRLTPEEIEQYKAKGKTNARFQMIDGHSRWYAACELAWHKIRAIITDMTLDEAREFNYKKNKVRGAVDPLREAAYFRYLHEVKKMRVDQIAEKFGIDHRSVERIISRLKITEKTKQILRGVPGVTPTAKHYEILGSITEPEKQEQLAEIIVEEELSRREAEVAKEALERGLPPEKTVKVVRAVKREKLLPKEVRKVVQALAVEPEAEAILQLPKEKLITEAEKIVTPPPPPKPPEEIDYERAMEMKQPPLCCLGLVVSVEHVFDAFYSDLKRDFQDNKLFIFRLKPAPCFECGMEPEFWCKQCNKFLCVECCGKHEHYYHIGSLKNLEEDFKRIMERVKEYEPKPPEYWLESAIPYGEIVEFAGKIGFSSFAENFFSELKGNEIPHLQS